jgi:isopentenyl-diphosphate delta-isomerase
MIKLILVNKNDRQVGVEEKLKAHIKGKLHRAFSILIINSKNQMLLQKRAKNKYHCPDLWSNTACSHPFPGEETEKAARRRLKEEMGFSCRLKKIGKFYYKKKFSNGLTENEIDSVFIGKCNKKPNPNKNEVSEINWISLGDLKKDMKNNPKKYTYWFKLIIKKYFSKINRK